MSESAIKRAYGRLKEVPLGHRIFGTAVTLKAPYFRTIRPRFVSLEPGRGEVKMFDRWAVRNHIGTVHAIACCNLAELVAGTTLDISLPDSHRWIPKGMSVAYLKKAKGELTGVATVEDLSAIADDEAREVIVNVDITDRSAHRRRSRRHHHVDLPEVATPCPSLHSTPRTQEQEACPSRHIKQTMYAAPVGVLLSVERIESGPRMPPSARPRLPARPRQRALG